MIKFREKNGEKYVTVTSVLELMYPKPYLALWRGKIGNEEANRISQEARERGRLFHKVIENKLLGLPMELNGDEYTEEILKSLTKTFNWMEDNLVLDGFWISEGEVYHPTEKYSGGYDLLIEAKEKDTLLLVDWKTGGVDKKTGQRYYPGDHPLQVAAYWRAYEEEFHTNIAKAYIVMVDEPFEIKKLSREELFGLYQVFTSLLRGFRYYLETEKKGVL